MQITYYHVYLINISRLRLETICILYFDEIVRDNLIHGYCFLVLYTENQIASLRLRVFFFLGGSRNS